MRIRSSSDKYIKTVSKQFSYRHRQDSELVTGTVLCTIMFQGGSCSTTLEKVSNLPFVFKVVEKVIETRFENHHWSNSLHDDVQSAYRAFHLTETALLRVHHDITVALDNDCCAVLLMLDLSASFDVIDHPILIKRMEYSSRVWKYLLWALVPGQVKL